MSTTTTTTTNPKPAVLLIHAGFHLPETYGPFLTELAAAGFVVRCPRLPTCGDPNPPSATLHDDVAVVRAEILDLMSAGHRIIVISHSYGGLVASEAITEDLYAKKKKGKKDSDDENRKEEEEAEEEENVPPPPGVVRLVYLSAWLLQPGTTLPHLLQSHHPLPTTALHLSHDPKTHTALPTNAPSALYNDLPPPTAQTLTEKLVPLNFGAATTGSVIRGAPWRDVRTWYVCCVRDRGVELGLQERMVGEAVENGAVGGVIEVKRLEAGHGAFWSVPGEVVGVLEEVWRGVVEGGC